MAVQQNKKSPSKRGMHRSHDALNAAPIAIEPTTGETWSGRGRMASWLVAKQKAGEKITKYLVK